jgi:peptide/nickel transport system substrate-binding protein
MSRAAVLCALALLAACSSPPAETGEASPYLRLTIADDVPTLDPAHGYDTASWQFEEMLFNTLVDYDDDGRIVPELAKAWDVSSDQRTYTFHLRRDVRFTNGRAFTAADVRYSIERTLNPETRSVGVEFYRGIEGSETCGSDGCSVSGIEVPDAHTIRFRLRRFDPLFLHKLTMPFAAAVPAEEVEHWGEDFARHPVGTGPFRLQEWVAGQRLLVVRNEAYFLPKVPRLQGVELRIGVNPELGWLKFEAGELDVSPIPPAEFPRVVRDPRYAEALRRVTTLRTTYLGMNCSVPPFDDRRVRQAMNLAIDKRKVLRLVNDRGVVARGLLPPNMPGFDPNIVGYDFDPQAARRLLAEAGHGDGFETTLWMRADPTTLRIGQSIQQDLAEVGVSVRIKALAWAAYLEAVRQRGQVPLFSLGWEADFPDPANFLEVLLHSRNIGSNNNSEYGSAAFDALIDRAEATVDSNARVALLQEAERLAVADAPWVFLYHPVTYEVVHARVRDYRLHPFRPPRLEKVWLD